MAHIRSVREHEGSWAEEFYDTKPIEISVPGACQYVSLDEARRLRDELTRLIEAEESR